MLCNLVFLCLCVCACARVHVPWCLECYRRTCKSSFSPLTMWALRVELRTSCLKSVPPLSCVAGSAVTFESDYLPFI